MKDQVRYCPKCGVESLERDRYGEERNPPRYKCEWICVSCGFGFIVNRSLRSLIASQMATEMRKMRPPIEKREKPRPADEELHALRMYAEKIDLPYTIFRSTTKPHKFKFNSLDGVCRGSLTFDKAKILLRGFELASVKGETKQV